MKEWRQWEGNILYKFSTLLFLPYSNISNTSIGSQTCPVCPDCIGSLFCWSPEQWDLSSSLCHRWQLAGPSGAVFPVHTNRESLLFDVCRVPDIPLNPFSRCCWTKLESPGLLTRCISGQQSTRRCDMMRSCLSRTSRDFGNQSVFEILAMQVWSHLSKELFSSTVDFLTYIASCLCKRKKKRIE